MKETIKRLETLFFKKINTEAGWGKERIKEEFRKALIEALLESRENDSQGID